MGSTGSSGTTTFTVDTLTAQFQNRPSLPVQQVGDRDGDGIPDDEDTATARGGRCPASRCRFGSSPATSTSSSRRERPRGRPAQGLRAAEGRGEHPDRSQLDTEEGRISLTSAADTGAVKAQTADFYQGIFQVKQAVPKKKPKKPQALVTDLVMKGQLPRSQCAPLKGARAAAAGKKKGPKSVLGLLWGNGKGKFRTSGKYSSATVRGTIWLTQDRCDGTLTKVTRGMVQVRDFRLKKTVTVKAGKSYLARAARAAGKCARKR